MCHKTLGCTLISVPQVEEEGGRLTEGEGVYFPFWSLLFFWRHCYRSGGKRCPFGILSKLHTSGILYLIPFLMGGIWEGAVRHSICSEEKKQMEFFPPLLFLWCRRGLRGFRANRSHHDVVGRALAWETRPLGHWAWNWLLGVSGSRPVTRGELLLHPVTYSALETVLSSPFPVSHCNTQHTVFILYKKRSKLFFASSLMWAKEPGRGHLPSLGLNDPGQRCFSFCLPEMYPRLVDLQRVSEDQLVSDQLCF